MDREALIERLTQIRSLVRERRFELALTLTQALEHDLHAVGDASPLRDLVHASRLSTETLIDLRALRPH